MWFTVHPPDGLGALNGLFWHSAGRRPFPASLLVRRVNLQLGLCAGGCDGGVHRRWACESCLQQSTVKYDQGLTRLHASKETRKQFFFPPCTYFFVLCSDQRIYCFHLCCSGNALENENSGHVVMNNEFYFIFFTASNKHKQMQGASSHGH